MAERERGFSLIEVLAALGVFSVGAMGLIHLQNNTTSAARHVEARFLAQIVAENAMADLMTTPEPLLIGVSTGEEVQRHRNFVWTRTIGPTDREGLLLIEISVTDPLTGQVIARLHSLRRGAGQ